MTIATCFQNFISKRKPNSTVSRLCSVLLHGRTVGGDTKPRQVFDRPGEVQVNGFSRDLYCFQSVLLTKESTIEASIFYDLADLSPTGAAQRPHTFLKALKPWRSCRSANWVRSCSPAVQVIFRQYSLTLL